MLRFAGRCRCRRGNDGRVKALFKLFLYPLYTVVVHEDIIRDYTWDTENGAMEDCSEKIGNESKKKEMSM